MAFFTVYVKGSELWLLNWVQGIRVAEISSKKSRTTRVRLKGGQKGSGGEPSNCLRIDDWLGGGNHYRLSNKHMV